MSGDSTGNIGRNKRRRKKNRQNERSLSIQI